MIAVETPTLSGSRLEFPRTNFPSPTRRQRRDLSRRQGFVGPPRPLAGQGFYSLPGGRVEFGESLHAALHREVDEETGLRIEILDLAGWREVLPGTGGGGHYLIMSFAARWTAREPVLNHEHDDFKWMAPDALGDLKLTGGLPEVIAAARRLIPA